MLATSAWRISLIVVISFDSKLKAIVKASCGMACAILIESWISLGRGRKLEDMWLLLWLL